MAEFTGERVIPGQVETDLWNEHVSRYAFARQYARSKQVLDAGCGTGYGSAELAAVADRVVAADLAWDAVAYARATFPLPNLQFSAAACESLPFAAGSFGMVAAFEVIEHLERYREFLSETARVLKPDGILIVSTPNKRYYAESRGRTGPNPFHVHEFETEEFYGELKAVFPHVQFLLQNRSECFAFHAPKTFLSASARIDSGAGSAEDAHFFVGLCSRAPLPELQAFVYVPKAANILREREQHVALLESQLAARTAERGEALRLLRETQQVVEERTRWARRLDAERVGAGKIIVAMQEQAARQDAKVVELEAENRAKTEWALETESRLGGELAERGAELAECVRLLDAAEEMVKERTLWAQRTEAQREQLASRLEAARISRWVKLGKKFGLGPSLEES